MQLLDTNALGRPMITRLGAAWSVFATLLIAVPSLAQRTARIGERSYEAEGAKWWVLDPQGARWEVVPGVIEIRFNDSVASLQKEAVRRSVLLTPVDRTKSPLGYERYTYDPSRDPVEVLQAINENAAVEDAYLCTRIKFLGSANDTYYPEQWYLTLTGVHSAWDVTTGSPSITVAVMDDGIDYGHEDLAPNIWLNPGEISGDMLDNDNDTAWYGWSSSDFVDTKLSTLLHQSTLELHRT